MRLIYPLNRSVVYGVVLILFIILIALIKIAFFPINNSQTKTITSIPASIPKTTDPCAQFAPIKGEVSCKEAKEIVFKKMSGLVLSINKDRVRKLWLFTIKPNDLEADQNEFIIGVDVVDGIIKYSGSE